ncbi:MAG TPA: acyltransferase [Polyangiaceae bacterium]|nr:acyltransferase [Polyangiaceae bacterium]
MTAPRAEPAPRRAPEAARAALAGHLPSLDGVRGLAILLVLFHRFDLYPETSSVSRVLARLCDLGWVGVQLFFVLSGFLITGILLDSKGSANYFAAFFMRRALRILPLYYATLVVGLILVPLAMGEPSRAGDEPLLWCFLSNWPTQEHSVFPHFWSLAVEEQFYWVWPFVVYALDARKLSWLCGALAAGALVVRIGVLAAGLNPEQVYTWTICRMDALANGAALAALFRMSATREWLARFRSWIAAATLALVLAAFVLTNRYERIGSAGQTLGYTVLALAFTVLVGAAALGEIEKRGFAVRFFSLPPLRTLGKYSYAAYIFHVAIHHTLVKYWVRIEREPTLLGALGYAAVGIVLSLLAAFASYQLFERHFLALKRRFAVRAH